MSKKIVKLSEKQLVETIGKIVEQSKMLDNKISYEDRKIIADDVINRIIEFGYDYVDRLNELNSEFIPTRLKRIDYLKKG